MSEICLSASRLQDLSATLCSLQVVSWVCVACDLLGWEYIRGKTSHLLLTIRFSLAVCKGKRNIWLPYLFALHLPRKHLPCHGLPTLLGLGLHSLRRTALTPPWGGGPSNFVDGALRWESTPSKFRPTCNITHWPGRV